MNGGSDVGEEVVREMQMVRPQQQQQQQLQKQQQQS